MLALIVRYDFCLRFIFQIKEVKRFMPRSINNKSPIYFLDLQSKFIGQIGVL